MFDFPGFTHTGRETWQGGFAVIRQTIRKRMRAKLAPSKLQLYFRTHAPIPEVERWLGNVLRGYYRYCGAPFNIRAPASFWHEVGRPEYRTLRRRSQKKRLTWERMARLVARWRSL